MGKIFYIMGKSACGKDSLYQGLLKEIPDLKTVILYTTRPIRYGETDGVEYHFQTDDQMELMKKVNNVIESRTYYTAEGPWSYFTIDDGQFHLENDSYLMIGTLESYEKMGDYFGQDAIIPLYIYVEPGLRLQRALDREQRQEVPKYHELCRRYLADEEDFSDENMRRCGINVQYVNNDYNLCLSKLKKIIYEVLH